jgi:galactose-1-phosphate uridylyltransferase
VASDQLDAVGRAAEYLAGVVIGAGTFVNDTRPEDTSAQLRQAARKIAS